MEQTQTNRQTDRQTYGILGPRPHNNELMYGCQQDEREQVLHIVAFIESVGVDVNAADGTSINWIRSFTWTLPWLP